MKSASWRAPGREKLSQCAWLLEMSGWNEWSRDASLCCFFFAKEFS
jgi:hypothetical protein